MTINDSEEGERRPYGVWYERCATDESDAVTALLRSPPSRGVWGVEYIVIKKVFKKK